jgi:hypothetical protein
MSQNLLNYVIHLCLSYDVLFQNNSHENSGFPAQLLSGQDCFVRLQTPVHALKPILEDIILRYSLSTNDSLWIVTSNDENVPSENGVQVHLDLNDFQLKSDSLRQALLKMSDDLLQYKQDLDDLTTWLQGTIDQLNTATDTSKMIPSLNILNAFRANATYFKAQFDSYLAANMSLYSLAKNMFDTSQYGSVLNCAATLSASIDDTVFTKLTSIISSESALVTQIYSLLLAKFANIQKYLGNSDKIIEYFLRNCAIWRKPIVNQQKADVSITLYIVKMVIP